MAVLANDANVIYLGGGTKVMGPAQQADIFYAGAVLFALNVHTTGKVSCVPTSGTNERFLGICSKKQTTTAADQMVEYYSGGVFAIPAIGTIDATEMGSFLVCDKSGTVSDNVADLVAEGDITPVTGDAVIGMIVGIDAAGLIIVDTSRGGGTLLTVTTLALQ